MKTSQNIMTETEINIIRGLRKRSPRAQQQTLELYGNIVWTQVVRLVPNVEDAEEVYQDVFIKIFNNIKMYDETKASLKTWIRRIAYNEAISTLRHSRQASIYFEEHEDELNALSESEMEETLGHPNKEVVQMMREAIKHLPPAEQLIITMFYYDEMSLKDIAYITGSIPTTIASKLCRTRKKLCKIINQLRS